MTTAAVLPNPMLPAPYRVARRRRETSDTFTLELAPADRAVERPFSPGQFNMLYAFGVGEVPISISGDPASAGVLVHTTRAVGAVTQAVNRLRPGDVLGVRGPFGTAWPVDDVAGRDVVIVTGGIGLAPLRPAIYRLLAERARYGKVVLLYGARSPADILYRKELTRWRGDFDLEVHVTVDRAAGGWRGGVGVVTDLIPRAPFDPSNTVGFVCGPEIMMRATVLALERRGVAAERIHVSMERNMKCGVGLCGHCQLGSEFVCRDGPIFRYDLVRHLLNRREV